ncbi:MAG: TlyA family RNA methyltransferase [Lachnospiraceae bacterium]|nr:TlyA family RNA methyltransferase [Lachnospiraceae bacterium]
MKKRLDVLLVEKGLAPSREKAKAYIMEGKVFVENQREDKPGTNFDENSKIELHGKKLAYVSRGGLKLEKALKTFPVDLDGAICMDIGASTGGFTDCMLQNGAAKVYSVDVGYGQFDWSLRQDPRVVLMEKTNVRYLKSEDIGEQLDFASCDVSFISLSKILPAIFPILTENGTMVCLIKPQFEAGRENVGKRGVVKNPKVHREVITEVFGFTETLGFTVKGLTYSPIKGPNGNIEYLMYIAKNGGESAQIDVAAAVAEAHEALDRR